MAKRSNRRGTGGSGSSSHSGRTKNGRFAKGFCPNPSGRPRKEKTAPAEALLKVLERDVPLADGTTISTTEFLMHILVSAARDRPEFALKILNLAAQWDRCRPQRHASVDEEADEEVLERFLARAQRRKNLSSPAAGDCASDDGDAENEDE